MHKRYLPLLLLGVVALVQLYVPAAMILEREEVLATGKAYKFRVAPVDPNDPFRGKYITLRYRHNTIQVADAGQWESGQEVYVLLRRDRAGVHGRDHPATRGAVGEADRRRGAA